MSDNYHVCDEECNPQPERPVYSLQPLDLIGIVIATIGSMIGNLGQGGLAIAREFYAAAEHRRQTQAHKRAQREIARSLQKVVDGDE